MISPHSSDRQSLTQAPAPAPDTPPPAYRWLGTVDYATALDLQYRLVEQRLQGQVSDTVLLLEHPAVITMGRRASERDVLASPAQLQADHIEVHRVTRGGETTYHGRGQLVGYIIFDIRVRIKAVAALMHGLEQAIARFLYTEYCLTATTIPEHPGVWIADRKIAAVGVSIQSGVTLHGFALNINPNPRHFSHIVACGMAGLRHTSLAQERMEITTTVQTDLEPIAERLKPHLTDMYRTFFHS